MDIASFAAVCAAIVPAKADDFLEPLKLALPEEHQEITFPAGSVIETTVLLNVAVTWAIPIGTVRLDFFRALTVGFFSITLLLFLFVAGVVNFQLLIC